MKHKLNKVNEAVLLMATRDLRGKCLSVFIAWYVDHPNFFASPKDLADRTGMDRSNVSKAIAQLIKDGWLSTHKIKRSTDDQGRWHTQHQLDFGKRVVSLIKMITTCGQNNPRTCGQIDHKPVVKTPTSTAYNTTAYKKSTKNFIPEIISNDELPKKSTIMDVVHRELNKLSSPIIPLVNDEPPMLEWQRNEKK